MGFMDKLMGTMTDQKGLFQGGEKDRVFGRARDLIDEKRGGGANKMERPSISGGSGGGSYGPNLSDDVAAWAGNPTASGLKNLKYSRAHGGKEGILDRIEGIRAGKYDIGKSSDEISRMGFKDIVNYAETSYMDDEGNFKTPKYPGFDYSGERIGDRRMFTDDDYEFLTSKFDEFRKNDPKFFEEFSGGRIYDRDANEVVGSHGPQHDRYRDLAYDAYDSGSWDKAYMTEGKYGKSGRGGQSTADAVIGAFEGKGDITNITRGLRGDSPVLSDKYRSDPAIRYATKHSQDERQSAFQEGFDEQMELYHKTGKRDPRIEEAGY